MHEGEVAPVIGDAHVRILTCTEPAVDPVLSQRRQQVLLAPERGQQQVDHAGPVSLHRAPPVETSIVEGGSSSRNRGERVTA
jgi:hypothetical protein